MVFTIVINQITLYWPSYRSSVYCITQANTAKLGPVTGPIRNYLIHLRNKFHFSEVHGSMNATGHVQSHVNFARDLLRSYFHDPQKNEIHLLYLHFVFTSFLFIICGILI